VGPDRPLRVGRNVDLYLVILNRRAQRRPGAATSYRFAADVRRAVMVDAHRGSVSGQANAFDTHVVRTEIDHEPRGRTSRKRASRLQFQFRDSIDDLTQSA
jgi:hypothetical protein